MDAREGGSPFYPPEDLTPKLGKIKDRATLEEKVDRIECKIESLAANSNNRWARVEAALKDLINLHTKRNEQG